MRVLYWTELFWPYIGGVQVASRLLITALQQRGCEFSVVTSHTGLALPDASDQEGITVYRFPFQKALATHDLQLVEDIRTQLIELEQRFAPNLIHLNTTEPSAFFYQLTRITCAAPTILTLHGIPIRLGTDTLIERLLRSTRWVAACSHPVLNAARLQVPDITLRSSVIHNGLDMPKLMPTPLPFDPPRLLCLGRLVTSKGFDLAIDAFARVAERWPTTRLIVAGDGPAKRELQKQAAKLGLTDAVEFVGWVTPKQVPALINTCTLVLVPSGPREGFSIVALQAAQMARPVVATNVGGIPDVVVDQETGRLVPEQDPALLAEAVLWMLKRPAVATAMGKTARERAQAMFSLEQFVNEYDELYHRIGAPG